MPFTPINELDLLCNASLVPESAVELLLQKNLHIRPLSSSDYGRGHLSPLADLTSTPDIGANAWAKRYNLLKSMSNMYYILVIVDGDTDKILATGTLVLEYKFIRGAGSVGHIEDIAVSKSAQGKKLGLHLVKALTQLSEKVGCYKSILDCGEDNKVFYEKCGHEYKGIQMANYVKQPGLG